MVKHKQSRSAPRPFGNYLLYEEIARGGMARVFRAGLRGLAGFEKKLVVKQILPELANDPRFVELFVREANTVVSLSHPHIVPVYDLGRVDGVYFLSMEYVEGATLAALLRTGPLSPGLAAHVGAQLSDALAYAHGRGGLVHRDVTPRNIMLDAGGHARLLDFGVAAPAEGIEGGEVFGSPGYMSPEQATGGAVDGRSDVFSLGASLFRALSGEEAFLRQDAASTHAALTDSSRPSFDAMAPAALAGLLERTLALRAEDRPDAAELGRGLRSWLAGEHPEGVSAELGVRVEALTHGRDAAEADDLPPESSESGQASDVQTLATRPAFAAMLREEGGATKLVARPSSLDVPSPDASSPPEEIEEGTRPMAARVPQQAVPDASEPHGSRRGLYALLVVALAAGGVGLASTAFHTGSRPPLVEQDAGSERPPRDASAPDTPVVVVVADASVPDATLADANTEPNVGRVRAMATLTVTATPWASVRLDGRALGTTPLRARRVTAGRHTLTFDNPPLGRSTHETIRLAPNETLWLHADLSSDPPHVQPR